MMEIAAQLQAHGQLANRDIRSCALATSSDVAPVMATPTAFAAGVAGAAAVTAAFTGGFAIG